ncbi:MAG: SdrD B-like domain-containing protein, partial [Planctomycetota bacterium]
AVVLVGEEWIYTAEIVATVAGQFTNIGMVTGTPVDDDDMVLGDDVTDDDPANYNVIGIPGIDIEKLTNGHDADTPEEAVEIAAGDTVTWTYLVTNTGSTTFDVSDVAVVDDNGTPLNTSDDFVPTLDPSSDVGSDNQLSPGEVWTFTASDTAQAVSTSGQTEVFHFDGNSPLDGPNGNVRSFTSGGVSVDVTGFSRDSQGVFETAYVGAYNGGLGVTDRSEGDGSGSKHRLDNIGRLNYLVFQFSESVVVDSAFLDSVVHDSDLSIWIGEVATSGPLSLSDAVLGDLVNETNMTNSSNSRWADFNAGGESGNVLVLAAWVDDHTPEDQFKVRKLKVDTVVQGVYGNIGTVTADTASDSDPSHYTNPAPAPSGVIGDFVWNDVDRDGKQDSHEDGVEGVTVTLFDSAHNVLDTTTTGSNGGYEFTGLEGGDYKVGFSNLPNDFVFTRNRHDISDAIDSDADRTTGKTHVITLDDHEINRTVDAGIYEAAVDIMFEAEDYEWKDHPWTVKYDSNASGDRYIKAPNGSGSHYHSPPHGKKVVYQFDVDVSGSYELSALIRAKNSKDNSLWVRIDGGDWIQWHTPITGHNYQWHAVTDGWHHESVAFGLDAGSHTLEIKVREDGLRLDKFMVSKLSTQTVVIDATDATSIDTASWIEVDDDGNEFLVAAGGNHYSAPPADSELTYDFTIDEAGVFDVYGLVSADNGGANSFWIAIDDGPWIEWHLNVTGDGFEWQAVTDGSNQESVRFDLSAGQHTLKIKVREDGTRLDKLVITNDANIDLNAV